MTQYLYINLVLEIFVSHKQLPMETQITVKYNCGQSYKGSTVVNYDSRVLLTRNI